MKDVNSGLGARIVGNKAFCMGAFVLVGSAGGFIVEDDEVFGSGGKSVDGCDCLSEILVRVVDGDGFDGELAIGILGVDISESFAFLSVCRVLEGEIPGDRRAGAIKAREAG